MEKKVLEFWRANQIPEKVRKKSWESKGPLFAFLEGPPTANGFMHIGHARGRTLKDVMLRYMRMKGCRVWDQAGWDTQGLPVELEVEKKLGLRCKKDIEEYGVEKFVRECSKLVDFYISKWREASERLGLWLDYDHAYETRHPRYLDAAWSFLKKAWEEGLLYEDLRVIPVCPRCETALSSHEVAQGYEEVEDPSLYFKVPLKGEPKTYMVAWTTTPWTIIANEALVVHPEETYVKVRVGDEIWILAEKRLEAVLAEAGVKSYEVVEKLKGRELEGLEYEHPLADEVPAHKEHGAHRVYCADWVTMEEGTGVVHAAPAHGPEDFELAREKGIRVFVAIAKNGVFTEAAGKYKGMWFREAAEEVVKDLERKSLVVHYGRIKHTYPHCWRCHTPLMYYADRQWFIKVEPVKKLMIESNESISWRPDWAKKRFGDWLENARDWCVSRERYWGTPLPIWTCKNCGHRLAVGSLEELRKLAVNPEEAVDHHRPWVDRVKIKCPKCGSLMEREPFVVDVWLDSGVAHTAALHQYGWDDLWSTLYPYTWITEAMDQTRGWFYTLLFTGAAWHRKAPYKAVLCQGHVLDKYGKKMSKSKGNVIWAMDAMEQWGADVLRLHLLSKAAPWDSINFDPDETKVFKRVLDILWSSANFALSYMELDKWTPSSLEEDLKSLEIEDRWILTEASKALEEIAYYIERNDMHLAARRLANLIVEKISRYYITLIRPRVWIESDDPRKRSAYATLYLVLTAAIKAAAPFTPYITEYLHQAFTRKLDPNAEESVHMEAWPRIPEHLLDEDAWKAVNTMFKASEAVLALRNELGVKRRWPLRRVVVVAGDAEKLREAASVLARYANVKEVVVSEKPEGVEGYRELDVGDGVKVYVDARIDREVLLEGLAREVIRRAQVMRKELDLPLDAVVEKLVVYTADKDLREAVEKHRDYIAREVRVKELVLAEEKPASAKRWEVEGKELYLELVL